ncbi:MAG: Tad domain-containing protein [Actinomycetota bacterium]
MGRPSHRPPAIDLVRSLGRSGEDGYVVVTSLLLLVPLVAFAALVVDVGAWYVEGQRAQRAADAGALAGVVWLPDETTATDTALSTVRLNGYPTAAVVATQAEFDTAPAGGAPVVLIEPTDDNEMRVAVKSTGTSFLGRVVGVDNVAIARSGNSRFVRPLTMGNPDSSLGGGVDEPEPDNYWLNILPESGNRNAGDLVSSINGATGPNPNHDARGYLFAVDVPPAATGTNRYLQVRSTCYTQNTGSADLSLYAPDDTAASDYDNVTPSNLVVSRTISQTDNPTPCDWAIETDTAAWQTIHDVGGQAGRWVLQARHNGTGGRVLYSLRVVDTAGASCVATDPGCVTVAGLNWLGGFTQSDMFDDDDDTDTELFLAEIGEDYAGNILEILLFDPADGIDAVKVKDAKGDFVDFTWDTIDVDFHGYDGGGFYTSDAGPFDQSCDGDSAVTSPIGGACDPTQPQRNWFQDRTVRIRVPISPDPCDGSWCWWKLVYINDDDDTNETITFRASVIGDPVRLTR